MDLFKRSNKWCINVSLDARPIGRLKLRLIHKQFGYTSGLKSLCCPFGLRPFERKCAAELDPYKYANM